MAAFRISPICVALFATLFAAPAWPADRPPPLPDVIDVLLSPPDPNDKAGPQMRAQFLPAVGREDLVLAERTKPSSKRTCDPDPAANDPLSEIVRNRLADHRIVIVNERHGAPQDRHFITGLLVMLSMEGFSVYAAETFAPGVGADAPPWPLLTDGAYSGEPVFGNLLREARMRGYRFVAYEHAGAIDAAVDPYVSISEREAGQAENLAAAIAAAPPNARFLIHVGYAHASERPQPWRDTDKQVHWMALRLREKTGLDPLTIDLTQFRVDGDAYVVCAPGTDPGPSGIATDLYLGAPDLTFKGGRPAWRQIWAKPRQVLASLLPRDEPVIIEARPINEPDEAVPFDRLMLRPGENLPLLLPHGTYRYSAWSRTFGWSKDFLTTLE